MIFPYVELVVRRLRLAFVLYWTVDAASAIFVSELNNPVMKDLYVPIDDKSRINTAHTAIFLYINKHYPFQIPTSYYNVILL